MRAMSFRKTSGALRGENANVCFSSLTIESIVVVPDKRGPGSALALSGANAIRDL
jgi:hypothetical protein